MSGLIGNQPFSKSGVVDQFKSTSIDETGATATVFTTLSNQPVLETGGEALRVRRTGVGGTGWHVFAINSDSGGSDSERANIKANGDFQSATNSYGSTSDERLKQDIVDAKEQWDDIKNLKIRNFKLKRDVEDYGDKAEMQLGVIAQEVEKICPNLVKESEPTKYDIEICADFVEVDENGKVTAKENVKSISYSILYLKAVKALQETMVRIETLEAKVKTLEG
tara:strand:+ start:4360 stop:5028 length:669 start_codon:yes stop_codon:yes gene_type:complete